MRAFLALTIGAALAAVITFQSLPPAEADTVYLKNGAVLRGKLAPDPERPGASRLTFRNGGFVVLATADIRESTRDDEDAFDDSALADLAPAADRSARLVRVVLKRTEGEYYGSGVYAGWPKASGDDTTLVLELPGGGELRVPRANIESTTPIDLQAAGLAPAVEPAGGSIPTTHRVTLNNGRVVVGNLLETSADEPIEIRVGDLGILRLERTRVTSVEKLDGSYELPASATEPDAVPAPKHEVPPEVIEKLKQELRREILRELLEGIIDEKIDAKLDATLHDAQASGALRLPVETLPAAAILDAQYQVRELCRQRNTNRVRAESQLKSLGPGVLEYLGPAAKHPLALTRRAVQRIVRDVGDYRGAPIAIDSLDDDDVFVRTLAYEAVRKVLGASLPYDAEGPAASREQAKVAYRDLWLEIVRQEARHAMAAKARSLLEG